MVKKIITYISLIILCLSVISFTACKNKMMEPVHFCLNSDDFYLEITGLTLMKNTKEFDEYLSDREVFKEEFCEEFIEENKKYDKEFFTENDLIAVIIWAYSIDVVGCRLNKIYKDNGKWILNIEEITNKKIVRDAMGDIFCYYITVEKDAEITGAQFEWFTKTQ